MPCPIPCFSFCAIVAAVGKALILPIEVSLRKPWLTYFVFCHLFSLSAISQQSLFLVSCPAHKSQLQHDQYTLLALDVRDCRNASRQINKE